MQKLKTIKDYNVKEMLGVGSYGKVFRVTKKNEEKQSYVLKQISLFNMRDEEIKEVKNEAKILSALNSKYIVKYYESWVENSCLNIIMEYCEKGDLSKLLKSTSSNGNNNINQEDECGLPEDQIWSIMIQMAIGLNYLHSKKILHRDLKTQNILITKNNVIKIGDLGVAKALSHTTFAKTFVGTPYYLSPEICEEKPYNEKSDIWALGCCVYQMATLKHPFNANSQPALIMKILNDKLAPISKSYSEDLQLVINLMMDKNHFTRPMIGELLRNENFLQKCKQYNLYDLLAYETGYFPPQLLKIGSKEKFNIKQQITSPKLVSSTQTSESITPKNFLKLQVKEVKDSREIKIVKTSQLIKKPENHVKFDIQKQVNQVYKTKINTGGVSLIENNGNAKNKIVANVVNESKKVNVSSNLIQKPVIKQSTAFSMFSSNENLSENRERCFSGIFIHKKDKKTIDTSAIINNQKYNKFTPVLRKVNQNGQENRKVNQSVGVSQMDRILSEQNLPQKIIEKTNNYLNQINSQHAQRNIKNNINHSQSKETLNKPSNLAQYVQNNIVLKQVKKVVSGVMSPQNKSDILSKGNLNKSKSSDVSKKIEETPDKDIFNNLFISVQDHSKKVNQLQNKKTERVINNKPLEAIVTPEKMSTMETDTKQVKNSIIEIKTNEKMIKSKSNFIISKVVSSNGKEFVPKNIPSTQKFTQELNFSGEEEIITHQFDDDAPEEKEEVLVVKKRPKENENNISELVKVKEKFIKNIKVLNDSLNAILNSSLNENLKKEYLSIIESKCKNTEEYCDKIDLFASKYCPQRKNDVNFYFRFWK